ncbi:phage antirepressor [Latilactobacillus sakei]|uniref:phage antirepressor n=1 Tax=Latilactobacillus sakei TaxID=1599 RepID=UPI003A8769F2
MNDLQLFNFKGNQVRTVLIEDEPYFIGKDVADILSYSRTTKAIQDHVEDEDKDVVPIQDSIGRKQATPIINESGLYSLILSSKLPAAKEFKRWVTKEVLPSIRKNGAYLTDQKAFDITHNPNALGDLLLQAGEQLKQKDLQIMEMKPKALFADSVATSHTTILVGDLAKILKQNGIEMGQKRLFNWLRDNKYLISRKGADYNSPTQKSMELGLFEIKESTHINGDGVTVTTKTPKVTGKGQQYFINKFLQDEAS